MTTLSHTISTLSSRRGLSTYTASRRPLVLADAVQIYLDRQARRSHPAGRSVRSTSQAWYPTAEEHCACCDSIRTPSRAYPWSLMTHCRTAEHIAHLYGLSLDDLQAAIRRAEDRGGDEAKLYREWLRSRAHLSPLVDLSGDGKIAKK
jgi:hypothetical protein